MPKLPRQRSRKFRAKRVPAEVRGVEKRWREKRRAICDATEETRVKRTEKMDASGRIGSRMRNEPRGIVARDVTVAD